MSKSWKNVSIPQCIAIMFISLICLITFVIPYSVNPLQFSFSRLLANENNLITSIVHIAQQGITAVIPATSEYKKIMELVYTYLIYGYIGIIAFNFVAAFLLILTRANFLRQIFRFFSIIFGIVLIISALVFVLYLVGVYGYMTYNALPIADILNKTGALFALGMVIFSIILSTKQFRWFTAPF